MLIEGDKCPHFRPEGCCGRLQLTEVENCSCHINAPCGACLSVKLVCDDCGEVAQ